jgi:hypothetical protein
MEPMLKMILDDLNHGLGYYPGTTLDKDAYTNFSDIFYDAFKDLAHKRNRDVINKLARVLAQYADYKMREDITSGYNNTEYTEE